MTEILVVIIFSLLCDSKLKLHIYHLATITSNENLQGWRQITIKAIFKPYTCVLIWCMAEFHQSQYSTNVKIVQVQWKSYIILHEMLASWLGAVLMADRKLMQTSLLIYINKHALSCPAVEQKALAFLFWALIWGPFFVYACKSISALSWHATVTVCCDRVSRNKEEIVPFWGIDEEIQTLTDTICISELYLHWIL